MTYDVAVFEFVEYVVTVEANSVDDAKEAAEIRIAEEGVYGLPTTVIDRMAVAATLVTEDAS